MLLINVFSVRPCDSDLHLISMTQLHNQQEQKKVNTNIRPSTHQLGDSTQGDVVDVHSSSSGLPLVVVISSACLSLHFLIHFCYHRQ